MEIENELPEGNLPTKGRRLGLGAKLLRGAILGSLIAVAMLTLFQRKLIYHPRRERVEVGAAEIQPALTHDLKITTADGESLHGWQIDPVRQPATLETRRLVIYFQGNAGHRGRRGRQVTMFSDLGLAVLIVDYRGYGENTGSPSETGLAEDARAIWKTAIDELGYRPEEIFLFGESLGGGVSTRLAADLCDAGTPPAGLMIRASFTSLVDAARVHYPFLPVSWLMVDRFPSVDRIPKVTCPILIMHGDQDQIVPYDQGERLFAAAPARSASGVAKMFVRLHGAGHNNILYVVPDQVEQALRDYLAGIDAVMVSETSGKSAHSLPEPDGVKAD